MIYDTWITQRRYSGNVVLFCSIISSLIISLWYNLVVTSFMPFWTKNY
jgi:hypothetical protein